MRRFTQPFIAAVSVNFRGPRYTQKTTMKEMYKFTKKTWPDFPYEKEMKEMFNSLQVKQRTMHFNPKAIFIPPNKSNMIQSQEKSREINTKILIAPIKQVLKRSNILPIDLKMHMFHSTLIGVPTYDVNVNNYFRFSKYINRIPLAPMGCLGGVSLVTRGVALLKDESCPAILLSATERFSESWGSGLNGDYADLLNDAKSMSSKTSMTKKKKMLTKMRQFWISAGLFGDGAAALVLMNPLHANHLNYSTTFLNPQVIDSIPFTVPNTDHIVKVYRTMAGMVAYVDQELTNVLSNHLPHVVAKLLDTHNLSVENVKRWIIHPGGPKILKTVEKMFSLSVKDLQHSWNSLQDNGNCASVSVLDVLHRTMYCKNKNDAPVAGDIGIMLAIGPGITIEVILLKW